MDNFIITNNYTRQNINDDRKNKHNILNQQNHDQKQDLENQTKFIMNRSITSSSNKQLDLSRNQQHISNPDRNIRISRINVDSRHRNTESKNILDSQIYYLQPNVIDIVSNTVNDTDIIIYQTNHGYQVNDNIVIQGVKSKIVSLDNSITFIENSSYARINHPNHGINFNTINTMNIEIINFIGSTNNNTDYYNIPINQINGLQQIYPTMSSTEIFNNNYYYILMGSIISNFSNTYNLSSIIITFQDINGINLNLINANYPTSINQLNGFQTIYYTDTNSYKIKLNINNNISIYSCGGDSIWIARVNDFTEGYINNNFYKIALKKTFYNVSKIRLISTEFPNTEKVIKTIPQNKQNNMFYWKLQSDGDTLYSIALSAGNYNITGLRSTMQTLIGQVSRPTLSIINSNVSTYSYNTFNNCIITLQGETDTFNIQFLTTIFIPLAITYKASSNYSDNNNRLIINHPNHRLIANMTITIINGISTDGIPQSVINNLFQIEKIIDANTYQVILPKYNIAASNNTITNGGAAMGIIFPVMSQLYFNTSDTIGNLIGYRNVGQPYSITKFNYTNANTDLYQSDILNNLSRYSNNSINLSGDNYILMTSPIFKEVYNTGLVDNIFAKLLLSGDPGSVLYNQFIQLAETFTNPIASFSEWEVYFYDASGDLYDFGNLEHSYTLEIYENIDRL